MLLVPGQLRIRIEVSKEKFDGDVPAPARDVSGEELKPTEEKKGGETTIDSHLVS